MADASIGVTKNGDVTTGMEMGRFQVQNDIFHDFIGLQRNNN